MTRLPLTYSLRNLWQRKLTAALTIAGIGSAVFVLAALMMAAEGLRHTLEDSGSNENAIFLRQPATSESRSVISLQEAAKIETLPGIGRGMTGSRLVARELAVSVDIRSATGKREMPFTLRGTDRLGLELRTHARLAQGHFFSPMTNELVLGAKVAETAGYRPGDILEIGHRPWRIAGVFAISHTTLDDELWGDIDQVRLFFQRSGYSSVLVRLDGSTGYAALSDALANTPQNELSMTVEREFYERQADMLSRFLKMFALFMGSIFAAAATAGATITMYAFVAHRTREIATLRALGFDAASLLLSILLEAGLIGVLGGALGVFAASSLENFSFTTLNMQSASGITFRLMLTPEIAIDATGVALLVGILGGLFPAWRVTRIRIHDALREAG